MTKNKEPNHQTDDVFKAWADNYNLIFNTFEDSYLKIYKPWIKSTGDIFEKAVKLSQEAAPENYKEFYNEWMKTCQNTFGKVYSFENPEYTKETLKQFVENAESSNKILKSWVKELENNIKKTQEILGKETDPKKYKECHETWMKSYEKLFNEILELPAIEKSNEFFKFGNYKQMIELWKKTHSSIYGAWFESISKLMEKMTELSKGDASIEKYKEFYDMWIDTYKRSFEIGGFTPKSNEVFEGFVQGTDVYLNMYKAWIEALEQMLHKAKELSTDQKIDQETYKEFYNLWIKAYKKAFDTFFDDMPEIGPMKYMMEPVKKSAKIYSDMFVEISKIMMKTNFTGMD